MKYISVDDLLVRRKGGFGWLRSLGAEASKRARARVLIRDQWRYKS